jgi:hypothetical protein
MKKVTISILGMFLLFACQQNTGEPTKEEKTETTTEKTEEKPTEPEVAKEAELKLGNIVTEVKILKHEEAKADAPGEQDIEIDLGDGYSLSEKGIWFSGTEWSCSKLTINKDGKKIHTWDSDKMERRPVIRNRKFGKDYPRLVTKGDNALVFFDIVLSPNDMNTEAVAIENGKFLKIVKATNIMLNKPEELAQFFEKAFAK